jgi:IS5 family transposase
LVTGLVNDALAILDRLEDTDLDTQQVELVGLLALVAGQDVEPGDTEGTWRIAEGTAADRVISTVDPEARHMHKSKSEYRDGYKAHVAVEPETGIITGCDLTPANAGDGPIGVSLLGDEPPGLEVLGDSAYGSGPVRADLAAANHTAVIKPWPLGRNPRLGDDQFHRDDFTVDYHAGTVTCPQGQTVAITPKGNAVFGIRCRRCPLRDRCTASQTGKTFRVTKHDQLLAQARADWRNGVAAEDYRRHRPMAERSIAWIVANGHRRVRYRGVERNRLGLSLRATAINLRRLINLGLHHGPNGWAITPT